MKNLFFIILAFFLIGCTVPTPGQLVAGDKPHSFNNPNFVDQNFYEPEATGDGARWWLSKNIVLEDTINGTLMLRKMIIKDSLQSRYVRIVDSLSSEFFSIRNAAVIANQGGDLHFEAFGNMVLNFAEDGTLNIGDFGLLIDKSGGAGNEYIQTTYDVDFTSDLDVGGDLTVTGRIINNSAAIEIPNVGGSSFEIDATDGNKWYLTLTDHCDIAIGNMAEGQELIVFITGGLDMALSPFSISWGIPGSELWYREGGNAPATQTQYVDKYIFIKIDGTIYCEQFPGQ